MTQRTKTILLVASALTLLTTGCSKRTLAPTQLSSTTLRPTKVILIDTTQLSVQVAATAHEQQQGLSGMLTLESNHGMLFTYSPATRPVFWMKDMLFPIDIIWIRDNRVVGVHENVQPPTPGQTESALPRYQAPEIVTAVLEVPAGWTTAHAVHTGSTVKEVYN